MLIENLEEKINDLEYKLENSDKQSIYFKWGMKNHGRILDNYKKQFESIKNDFDNMSVAELENELTEKKKKCNSLKVRSWMMGLYKGSLKSSINYLEDLLCIKNKYSKIELYELTEKKFETRDLL